MARWAFLMSIALFTPFTQGAAAPTPALSPEGVRAGAPRSTDKTMEDSALTDSMNSSVYKRRADYAFALRDYATARAYYKKASLYEGKQCGCRYRWGLAALASGDTVEAVRVLVTLADSVKNGFSGEAATLLGEITLQRDDYSGAMAYFQRAGNFSADNGWSLRALMGKLACAKALGLSDSAVVYDRRIAPFSKTLLERETLSRIREAPLAVPGKPPALPPAKTVKPDSTPSPAIDSAPITRSDTEERFALQVGSFGSRDHALMLRRRLAKKFNAVACVPSTVGERTIYRLWVGDFQTRKEAEAYGREKVSPQGYVYRVVTK
jgi:cell division septation protein DedD